MFSILRHSPVMVEPVVTAHELGILLEDCKLDKRYSLRKTGKVQLAN